MARPHWSQVETSLDQYDREAVRSAVLDVLRHEQPVERARTPSPGRAVHEALNRALGAWYQAGPTVGDETVVGWCWCHSFWAPAKELADTEARYRALADGVVEQVEVCRDWRLGLARWIWDHAGDGSDETLEGTVLELVSVLVGLGLHDSWYAHVPTAVAWTLESRGRPVPPDLDDQLEALASTSFTSWVEPTADARKRFAESAAWAVVERALDAEG
ncbi:MAG: hypothetical protein H6737_01860 [Alphaproteobacteria bacterium]|nr:hypothetical protein [Alphaproteobacteria bacterium]